MCTRMLCLANIVLSFTDNPATYRMTLFLYLFIFSSMFNVDFVTALTIGRFEIFSDSFVFVDVFSAQCGAEFWWQFVWVKKQILVVYVGCWCSLTYSLLSVHSTVPKRQLITVTQTPYMLTRAVNNSQLTTTHGMCRWVCDSHMTLTNHDIWLFQQQLL